MNKSIVFRNIIYINYIISLILLCILEFKAGLILFVINLVCVFIWNNTSIGVKK